MNDTVPANDDKYLTLTLEPSVSDPKSGALFAHKDYVQVIEPWAAEKHAEEHIGPIKEDISFGDVESWVQYLQYFAVEPLITWAPDGLKAVLDYHQSAERQVHPARAQWVAKMPFKHAEPWTLWRTFANGAPREQKAAIEFLEDRSEEIVEPAPADVVALLRNLRANVSTKAVVTLEEDGSTSVAFAKENRVDNNMRLPSEIKILVPVLKGHTEMQELEQPDGTKALRSVPVTYKVTVRLRATAEDNSTMTLRFSIPNFERVQESAYNDRVETAKGLLGDSFRVLRGAS